MAVTKRLRFEVLRRDGFACRYCGAKAPHVELTVDHVTPRALGGTDTADNLVAACQPCNAGKTSSSPSEPTVADVAADALRWSAAVRAAQGMLAARERLADDQIEQFDRSWRSWTWTDDAGVACHVSRPSDWETSIRTMLAAGLTSETLQICVTVAMRANPHDTWTYFCGVAWSTLRDAQRIATAGQ